jgi:hypothetical protein
MPRYFFHVFDGQDVPDLEGTELADDAMAKAEAIVAAGSMLSDLGGQFWNGEDWMMRVDRGSGGTVCELRFSAKR